MLFGKSGYAYNASVRGYVSLFGTLFSDIVLQRNGDDNWISVPLRFGSGNLYEKAPQNAAERDNSRVRELVPSASFYIVDLQRDGTRQTNRHQPMDVGLGQVVTSRVPYNITFELAVRNKNYDDHLQILEQISTTFDPTITVKFKPWSNASATENVVILLDAFSVDDNFDSQVEDEERRIETTYTFTLKGYLNRGVKTVDPIEEVVFGTGTGPDDSNLTVFVSDKGTLKVLQDHTALSEMIENGLFETVLVNPDTISKVTKSQRRKKKLNN